MKRKGILILMTLFLKVAIGQNSLSITAGFVSYMNKPFEYGMQSNPPIYDYVIKEYKRTFGYSLGYSLNWKIKDNLSIDFAPHIILSNEEYKVLNSEIIRLPNSMDYIYSGKLNEFTEKGNSYGLVVPVSLKINIYKSKLFFHFGGNFTDDRLRISTELPIYGDPAHYQLYNSRLHYPNTDTDYTGKYKNVPFNTKFGIGSQIGLDYEFSNLAVSCNVETTRWNDHPFSSLNIGLKYKISKKTVKSISDSTQHILKHSIGFTFGHSIGNGISYRFFPKRFGFQTTFGPWKNDFSTRFNLSLSLLYKLIEFEKANVFIYQGNRFFHYREKNMNNTSSNKYYDINLFDNGIGFGLEIIALKRLSINIMNGYSSSQKLTHFRFIVEGALYYTF